MEERDRIRLGLKEIRPSDVMGRLNRLPVVVGERHRSFSVCLGGCYIVAIVGRYLLDVEDLL